jgi:hypothetical protein
VRLIWILLHVVLALLTLVLMVLTLPIVRLAWELSLLLGPRAAGRAEDLGVWWVCQLVRGVDPWWLIEMERRERWGGTSSSSRARRET